MSEFDEIGEMSEMYEIVNSVKWVNGEISAMSEMYEMVKWVKSGFHYVKA